jgi:hypothetical protein
MGWPKSLTVSLALLVVLAGISSASATGLIKGKATHQGEALAGVVISLYPVGEEALTKEPAFKSSPTGADGLFEVSVKAGQYFLLARTKTGEKAEYFSYYGGNPIVAGEGETINIGVNLAPVIVPPEKQKSGGTGISGTIYADGTPLAQARVTLYQDASTIFRGIGYASAITNAKGNFSFSLEPGEYYVVARKRASEERMGPLSGGDFFGFSSDNPVKVVEDKFTVIAINVSVKLEKVKEGGQDITLGGTVKAGGTQVSGVVRDSSGKPIAGVYAAAYRDSMMTMKPDFISAKTGPDGVYTITLSEGGVYFIGARNTLGGPAEKGDLLGRYAGSEDHSITAKTGEKMSGIDITVENVE